MISPGWSSPVSARMQSRAMQLEPHRRVLGGLMRHCMPLALCLGLLVTAAGMLEAGDDVAADPSTLSELVRSAVVGHEDVARAASGVRRAQADVRLASSVLLPRLELNGQWTKLRNRLQHGCGNCACLDRFKHILCAPKTNKHDISLSVS